jgi:hypothetical protein
LDSLPSGLYETGVCLDDHPVGLDLIDHSAAVEGGIVHSYSTLHFDLPETFIVNHGYCMSFEKSLSHPVRAGKYILDGPKCALIVRFFLDCFIQPSSERDFLEQVVLFAELSTEY